MPITFENITITGGINILIPPLVTDQYWSNVTLLMNNTTTNNQTNNTLLDGSTNNFTITRNGTLTQGSVTPFTVAANISYSTSVNGGSGYFNGSTDYANVASNSAFAMGTGDFTLEAWIYYTGATPISNGPALISCRVSGVSEQSNVLAIGYNASNKLTWSNGNSWLAGATDVTANTWHHVAVTRSSNTVRIFLDGKVDGTFANQTANLGTTRPCAIGAFDTGGTGKFTGYISSARVVKGAAVYTSAFTPSTTPLTAISGTSLLLNFTNAGIYDSKTTVDLITVGDAKVSTTTAKFGTASVYFDGTGDYANVVSTGTNYTFGTGDFTIEFFMNSTQTSATAWAYVATVERATLVDGVFSVLSRTNFSSVSRSQLCLSSWFSNAWADYTIPVTSDPNDGVWHHVAFVRSGTNIYGFFDGTLVATYTIAANRTFGVTGRNFFIGANPADPSYYNGYLQQFRVTKGIARYTGSFTPPSESFPTA